MLYLGYLSQGKSSDYFVAALCRITTNIVSLPLSHAFFMRYSTEGDEPFGRIRGLGIREGTIYNNRYDEK